MHVRAARGAAVDALVELHAAYVLHVHRNGPDLSAAWWPMLCGDRRLLPIHASILIREGATDAAHEEVYANGLVRWASEVQDIMRDAEAA